MLYGRPFVYVNDLFLDREAWPFGLILWLLGNSNKIYACKGINQDPKDSKEPRLYAPGAQVLIKAWKDGSPKAQLQPTWKGSYPVILSTPSAVKVAGHNSWIHYLQVNPWKKTEEDTQYTSQQATACSASSTRIDKTTADHKKYHSPLEGHCCKDSEAWDEQEGETQGPSPSQLSST